VAAELERVSCVWWGGVAVCAGAGSCVALCPACALWMELSGYGSCAWGRLQC
jgi:ferredoxin